MKTSGDHSTDEGADVQDIEIETPKEPVKVADNVDDKPANSKQCKLDRTLSSIDSLDEVEEALDYEAEDGDAHIDGDATVSKTEKDMEEGEITDDDEMPPQPAPIPKPLMSCFHQNPGPTACRYFLRGGCARGNACRYFHAVGDPWIAMNMVGPIYPLMAYDCGVVRMVDYKRFDVPEQPPAPEETPWEKGLQAAREIIEMKRERERANGEKKTDNKHRENKENSRSKRKELSELRRESKSQIALEERLSRRNVSRNRSIRDSHKKEESDDRDRHRRPKEYRNRNGDSAKKTDMGDNAARGDEWQDPWMRSKSPSRKRNRSSTSSSSDSSNSSSECSSYRSHSSSPREKRLKSSLKRQKRVAQDITLNSPKKKSIPEAESKLYRDKIELLAAAITNMQEKEHSRSSSGSSSSTDSESSTSSSSSSDSDSSEKEEEVKEEMSNVSKKKETIKLNLLKDKFRRKSGGKTGTRKEELLKQLRAVEDAIARKRSKAAT